MAGDAPEKDQKTEDATPHKLRQMAEDGNVPVSQDVTGVAALIAMTGALGFAGGSLATRTADFATRMWRLEYVGRPVEAIAASEPALRALALPIFVTAGVVALVGVAQARNFSTKALGFKPERLNPLPNMKKVFPSKETFAELGKQLIKVAALGWVAFDVIQEATPVFAVLPASDLMVGASTVADYSATLALRSIMAFLVVAAFDYWWTIHKFQNDAKMSLQEVKDERKQEEVDPKLKQKARQRAADIAASSVADLSTATVVVTNPTHFAVALRYEPDTDDAPMLLAKGVDHAALELRSRARRHGVPMMENRPLARALYAEGQVGEPIPLELYRSVAEVIAYVMQLRAGSLGAASEAGA